MPRQIAEDDEKPRRRRRAAAVAAVEAEPERGLIMRVLLHSPKDTLAATAALAAVIAIVTNAMFLQAGRHPSPMFSTASVSSLPAVAPASAPLPRVRPAEAEPRVVEKPAESATPVPAKQAATAAAPRPLAPVHAAKSDPVGDLIVSTRRIAAVQRALTEYGYGQLKPTGVVGTDTQAAIQKFERDRKMPVTGQLSDRLIRDLTVLTGRPIE
ncbi:MAG: peptidoglycan-binding protein [Afipia sp.]|nr:peptidoglycan-binding protein [Afipia sp.]MBS4005088.1 peptidoglycan-binding protein [Afipia sp.]